MRTPGSITLTPTFGELSDADLRALGPDALDAAERDHALSMRAGSGRSQFVSRRVQRREAMAAFTGTRHEDVSYWREPCAGCGDEHGRPRAVGFAGYFSSSSTPHITALAVDGAPVGIDVEECAPMTTVLDVLALLHPAERAAVEKALAHDPEEARCAFTQIWTRKEALLKATGEGLTAPLDRDDLSDPTARPVPGWCVRDLTGDLTGFDAPTTFGAWAGRA